MDPEVDSRPTDKPCSDKEYDSIPGKPESKKGHHHERKISMGAWKTGIQNFTRAFGEFRTHLQKQERPRALDEEFETVDDCRLNGIKKNKITEDFSAPGYDGAEKNKENEREMASEVGEPGQGMIKEG